MGGWPTLDNVLDVTWNESAFAIEDELATVRAYSVAPLFRVYVGTDEKNSGKRILKVVLHIVCTHELVMKNYVIYAINPQICIVV